MVSSTKRSYKSRLIMLFKTEKLYLLKIDPSNCVCLSVIRENFYINKPITKGFSFYGITLTYADSAHF